tara:strand:+ start:28 stop:177 length:150 start_codon:yes stop_codon:yes gene_type:complete
LAFALSLFFLFLLALDSAEASVVVSEGLSSAPDFFSFKSVGAFGFYSAY